MADYEVIYADLVTGVVGGRLPVETIKHTTVLSAPGSASFTLPLSTGTRIDYRVGDDDLTAYVAPLTMTDLAPWRTSVFVQRDGVVVWSGIIANAALDVNSDQATIGAVGWHAYWRRRYLRQTELTGNSVAFQYLQVDQAAIVRSLIDYAQSVPGGDIGIDTTETTTTGVLRDRVWYAYDRECVGDLIDDLAACENGFDFHYVSWRDGVGYRTAYRTLFPRTGRATNLAFVLGVNCDLMGATVDGDHLANRAEATGAGEAASRAAYLADAADSGGYPLLEAQDSYSDVTRRVTLLEKAKLRLRQGANPVVIPSLAVRPDAPSAPYGAYQVGDAVTVRGSHGLLDIDDDYRITTIDVAVSTDGAESVALDLAPLTLYGG